MSDPQGPEHRLDSSRRPWGLDLSRGSQGSTWSWVLAAFLALGLAVVLLAQHITGNRPPSTTPPVARTRSPPASSLHPFLRGVYGSTIMQPSGRSGVPRIDAAATIAALSTAHVNTYAYLICPDRVGNPAVSRSQLQDLPEFARLAGQAGVEVYVYLVPPTEARQRAYAPFQWNYVGWAAAIGRLAVTNRAIKGIILDDFAQNTVPRHGITFSFTPRYVKQMAATAHAHAPWLSIYPVLYYHDLVGPVAVLSRYRDLFSGVVFPYFGNPRGHLHPGNTIDASRALEQGIDVAEELHCPNPADCTSVVFPTATPTDVTPAAAVQATVKPLGGSRRTLTVRAKDDRGPGPVHYQVEVLVEQRVLGSWVPAAGWTTHTFDVTTTTSRRSAVRVGLRVRRLLPMPARSTSSTILLDDLVLTGFDQPGRLRLGNLSGAGGASVAPASDLPLIFMTYATPLSAERGRGASPQYVARVLGAVDVLRRRQLVQGSLLFNVHLPESSAAGDPRNFGVVQEIYRRWEAG